MTHETHAHRPCRLCSVHNGGTADVGTMTTTTTTTTTTMMMMMMMMIEKHMQRNMAALTLYIADETLRLN